MPGSPLQSLNDVGYYAPFVIVELKQAVDGWQNEDFNATTWSTEKAAWGSPNLKHISNRWTHENSDIYIRRAVQLTAEQLAEDLYLKYSHDDVFGGLREELRRGEAV